MKLSVATCQFPTSADMQSNCQYVSQLMKQAREQGAEVAHFPEACLSGYAGADLESYDGFDWQLLHDCTYQIMALAGAIKLWTILGRRTSCPHRISRTTACTSSVIEANFSTAMTNGLCGGRLGNDG